MDFRSEKGQNTATITPDSISTFQRTGDKFPGITLIVEDSKDDRVLVYLNYEQSAELNNKLKAIVAPDV